MKIYNRFIVLSILTYAIAALGLAYIFTQMNIQHDQSYRIEINRIMEQLQTGTMIEDIDVSKYGTMHSITFLDAAVVDEKQIKTFYNEVNRYNIRIVPWYQQQQLKGYVKFHYEKQSDSILQIGYLMQGVLALFETLLLLFLFYLRKVLIKPFHRLSSMPYELSKGHVQANVSIEKSKYFQQYLWGMSQLQDTLKVTKKRQYDLMKEKKQLLLSLSHDIKTPLNLIKLYSKALHENLCEDVESRQTALEQIEKKSIIIEEYVESIIKSTKEDLIDFTVEQGEFYLSELLKQVLGVYTEQCRVRNIICHVGSYEDRLLKGDIHRAQEVMENLFENAFKYGDGGYIDIYFNEEEYHQLIHIKNSGVIIQDQEVHHVFDSFYRGSNAQNCEGSGLGLYICKELMRRMDGAIFAVCHEDGMEFVLVFQ